VHDPHPEVINPDLLAFIEADAIPAEGGTIAEELA
jgi:hypothetical protein